MKKLFLLLALTITYTVSAQEQIPNASFEQWIDQGDYEDPEGWATLNLFNQFSGPITTIKTDTAYHGNYACEMVSSQFSGNPIAGFAFTGDINSGQYGIAFTSSPTRVLFDYKSFPLGNDSCYFIITLSHWDTANNKRDSIAYAEVFFDKTISTFTLADIPLTYSLTGVIPDTLGIFMASSYDTANLVEGSRFVVDNIRLSYYPVGISNPQADLVSFYPNPTSDLVSFNTTLHLEVNIYSTNGVLIKTTNTNSNHQISVADIPKGIYYLRVREQNSSTYFTNKLIKL